MNQLVGAVIGKLPGCYAITFLCQVSVLIIFIAVAYMMRLGCHRRQLFAERPVCRRDHSYSCCAHHYLSAAGSAAAGHYSCSGQGLSRYYTDSAAGIIIAIFQKPSFGITDPAQQMVCRIVQRCYTAGIRDRDNIAKAVILIFNTAAIGKMPAGNMSFGIVVDPDCFAAFPIN